MAMAAIQNMTLQYNAIGPIFGQTQYTQIPMAALGIAMKFFQIVISIAVGLAAGCTPVVGIILGQAAETGPRLCLRAYWRQRPLSELWRY